MSNNIFKLFLAIITIASMNLQSIQAQISSASDLNGGVNAVFTSIPFLRINPDGRAGGMGDLGLATSPDASSIYHNNAKLAFAEDNWGAVITYTPWLKELVPDMFIGHIAGFNRMGDLQTIGASLRYFNLGSIQFTDEAGVDLQEFNPHEFAFDLGYSRKLSEKMSAGLTLKYVYSNLAKGQQTNSGQITAAQAVAADLSFFYNTNLLAGTRNSHLGIGAAISNIGNKVSYTEEDIRDFIPINFGLGAAYTLEIDDYNTIMFGLDINKLLVPTPDTLFTASDPEVADHREKSLFQGMFGSFGDAPGGFGEEMQELMYSIGAEYWYNNQFAVRAGYFHEHAKKGNRQYLTFGVGLKYSMFGLNFSYLVPTSSGTQSNPLQNTLRFSLLFDLEDGNN